MNAKSKKFVVIMAIILAALMVASMATTAIALIISSLSKKADDGHNHTYLPSENFTVLSVADDYVSTAAYGLDGIL